MSDLFLHTTDRAVAEAFCAELDAQCGYPNPATLTERAVAIQEVEGGFVVPVTEVYAPALRKYLDAKEALPEERREEAPLESVADIQAHSELAAEEIVLGKVGAVQEKGDVVPEEKSPDDKPAISNFVFISRSVAKEMIESKVALSASEEITPVKGDVKR